MDFNQYVPPGVYVDAGSTPTLSLVGVAPSVICLIGEGVGYHTFTETVTFGAGVTSRTLTKKGIDVSSIVVSGYVTDPAVAGQSIPYTFAPSTTSPSAVKDYTTTVAGSGGTSVTTLVKESGSKMEVAYPTMTVSYRYTDADYYGVHEFTDFVSFQSAYGPPQNPTTGEILSPLSYAAQIATANGVNRLFAIALSGTGTKQAQFAEAYTLLSNSNTTVDLVVPLWNGITDGAVITGMITTLNAALAADAANAVMRMAVLGLDQDYAGTTSSVSTMATATPSSRIVLSWPNKFNSYNGYVNSTMTVDGFYMAAALAAQLATRTPQEPLTRKYPLGFSGMPTAVQTALRRTDKDTLAASGVTVIETDRQGRVQVRHGLTTNYAGGVLNREISIVRARDSLYSLIHDSLDTAALTGTPLTDNTPLQVKSIVAGALERAKNNTLIVDYRDLAVRQQIAPSGDPTVIEVKFSYKPTYPLNYILVSFSVDTISGEVTTITPIAA